MSALSPLIQHTTGSSSQRNTARQENKRHYVGKKATVPICMIVYIENPKELKRKIPPIINKQA